jgi:hypothetical protein
LGVVRPPVVRTTNFIHNFYYRNIPKNKFQDPQQTFHSTYLQDNMNFFLLLEVLHVFIYFKILFLMSNKRQLISRLNNFVANEILLHRLKSKLQLKNTLQISLPNFSFLVRFVALYHLCAISCNESSAHNAIFYIFASQRHQ